MSRIESTIPPEVWGIEQNEDGELMIGGCSTVALSKMYQTPLHVVHEERLRSTAVTFRETFEKTYPGRVSVHYAFKCNSVPGVIRCLQQSGMKAEVMSDFELNLAFHLGFGKDDIIINGPCKTRSLLEQCIEKEIRLIVVDSIEEMELIADICAALNRSARILLRINPHVIPQGMNQGSATGSRKGCAFGLDLMGGEVEAALIRLKSLQHIQFHGFHFHIGTGIHHPEAYVRALKKLKSAIKRAEELGLKIDVIDIGGGFGAVTTREMTTAEMLLYQGWNRMPKAARPKDNTSLSRFAEDISGEMINLFRHKAMPELLIEPGRSITSSNQMLLLMVHRIKERPKIQKWLVTDGGLGTVSMPTFYEYHEIFLCNELKRPRTEKVTIIGPVCFAGDFVYKNKSMPAVHPGEVLAIMDSGAYFTALESSFGFPHPAVVSVLNGRHTLLRRRETFDDMIFRDLHDTQSGKGVQIHEIRD